jgi:hypothetical protein
MRADRATSADAPATRHAAVQRHGVLSNNVIGVPIDRVAGLLSLPDLEIDPSHVRVLFGLKLKL